MIQEAFPKEYGAAENLSDQKLAVVPVSVDRSMGDIHASGNPHYWLDPENARIIARGIAQRLSELVPAVTNSFQQNLQSFENSIDQKMIEWKRALSPYQGEKIISYHSTWSYFVKRFGLEIVGQLEPKPGIPPTPSHLQSIIEKVRSENVKVILNESIYQEDAAKFIAERTGAVVVAAPVSVGGSPEVKDYVSLMDEIVRKLTEGFKK